MILILSAPNDQHADHVEELLRARGALVLRFDPAELPRAAEVSLAYAPTGERCATLRVGDETLALETVRSVWYRRPGTPTAHADVTDPAVRTFIEQECATFVRDLWSSLDALWLPGKPTLVRDGALKASQLKLAGELGFELPPTLVSNSPDDVVDFYRRHGGRIVSKCEGHGLIDAFDQRFVRYTELVSPRDIAHARAIRHCPMIFQAYVDKRVELRITVVGRRVFAAEIHSQVTNHTKTDWRHYDLGRTPHLPHALPADVERRCLALVERMGLCYGAIDMILTPDGRYVFVEINPNGQYLWIEQTTGLPISDAICDLLVAGAPDASALDEPFASIGGAS